MTVLQSIRSRLPSRNWSIFWGVTGGLTGLGFYDKYHLKQVREDLSSRASVLATQHMPTWEVPRKVKVFVAPTHWARYWFKEYVKPVFDAAALDYEVIEPKDAGQVRQQVRDLIWKGKDEFRARPANYVYEANPYNSLALNVLSKPTYDAAEGLVAVGPNSWREVLRGLNEGAMSERGVVDVLLNEKAAAEATAEAAKEVASPPPTAGASDAAAETSSTSPTAETATPPTPPATPAVAKTDPVVPPSHLLAQNLPPFALPSLGYITGRNQSGYSGFPKRIWGYFNERYTAREIGEEALKIAFDRVREFTPEDANLGAKDVYVHKDWDDELKKVVGEVQIEEPLLSKLYIYA
ncbi:mitochondrial import inner membrane translocase subunit Tim54 [Fimicolochytrium jonesii]|uniref:mitochondrial import inner membrane translocase subunit Tim54 n=1 Tax=Fimicolochytrium jonesii TaxID=1396493 RepID=UPI0022FDB80E|nr:mitochondrial import inner membrane translocase subunit Tim54 [Fimicolochytrium jonesii]KAI8823596.1 mitochondrial import inner membrane translocase subunit Tim54 [Fimicolochytrium jonesii]